MKVKTKLTEAALGEEQAPPSNVNFGKPYGGQWAEMPDGRAVWAFRKGQRVRFFDQHGTQIGPEQANVAPAMVYAQAHGWDLDTFNSRWNKQGKSNDSGQGYAGTVHLKGH